MKDKAPNDARPSLCDKKKERRGGERGGRWDGSRAKASEGSGRVSQRNYTGKEGWQIEVCNWLPGED